MKINKPLLIILGEPNSVFIEILSRVLNSKKIKKKIKYPIILIGSKKLIIYQLKILKKTINFKTIDKKNFNYKNFKNKIYLIDIKYKFKKAFEKISTKSNNYLTNCFSEGLKLLNSKTCEICPASMCKIVSNT